jgi:hypothetical protein
LISAKTRITPDPPSNYRGKVLHNPQHFLGYPLVKEWARTDRWFSR